MALIHCSECGKEISDKASACPNCGCPVEVPKQQEPQGKSEEIIIEDPNGADKKKKTPKEPLSAKKKAIIYLVAFTLILAFVVVGIVFLRSYLFAPKGYEIGEGIYLGMEKDEVLGILHSAFNKVEESKYSNNEYHVKIDNTRGRIFFNITGFSSAYFKFNGGKLSRVEYIGRGDHTSWWDVCGGLGLKNVTHYEWGAWYKGHEDIGDDTVMLIAYCFEDPEKTGYLVYIESEETAEKESDYKQYYEPNPLAYLK